MSNDTQAAPTRPARALSPRLATAHRWLTANDDANTYRLCLALFLLGACLDLMAPSRPSDYAAPVAAQEVR